ncbi:hypothetical protein ACFSTD_08545 [Novosphingobium colocasiae]
MADGYREKIMATTGELSSEAKARSDEAMEKGQRLRYRCARQGQYFRR